MKTKICSFCQQETTRLFYANPKCCTKASCLMAYKNQKHDNKPKIKKAKPIKNISDKQLKRLAKYRPIRDAYLKANPICECCIASESTDIHHKAGRIGDLLWDNRHFLAVCRNCHTRIETSPDWAKEKGYSVTRLDK